MDPHDRAALQAAVEMLLRIEPAWEGTVADMLQRQPWEQVAIWAAGVCQVRTLKLRPWECAPCDTIDGAPADRYGSRPNEVALLRRMLAAGVSRFHPDPMSALVGAQAA